MYELREETKELIERIRQLDINAPMCCAILDLAAALEAKQRELDGALVALNSMDAIVHGSLSQNRVVREEVSCAE